MNTVVFLAWTELIFQPWWIISLRFKGFCGCISLSGHLFRPLCDLWLLGFDPRWLSLLENGSSLIRFHCLRPDLHWHPEHLLGALLEFSSEKVETRHLQGNETLTRRALKGWKPESKLYWIKNAYFSVFSVLMNQISYSQHGEGVTCSSSVTWCDPKLIFGWCSHVFFVSKISWDISRSTVPLSHELFMFGMILSSLFFQEKQHLCLSKCHKTTFTSFPWERAHGWL